MTENKLTKTEISMLEDIFKINLDKYTDLNGKTVLYGYMGKHKYFEIIKIKNDIYKIECNYKTVFKILLKKTKESNQCLICNLIENCPEIRYDIEISLVNKWKNINI